MLTTKEERKHIKKAITILFIFATENARIIFIIQKANANLIAFFSIDQPFTYAMEAARQRATEKGFVCSEYGNVNTVVTEQGEHRWLQTECRKKSAELFCPQMRFVVLNVDPNTNRVVDVGNYVNQHTCF